MTISISDEFDRIRWRVLLVHFWGDSQIERYVDPTNKTKTCDLEVCKVDRPWHTWWHAELTAQRCMGKPTETQSWHNNSFLMNVRCAFWYTTDSRFLAIVVKVIMMMSDRIHEAIDHSCNQVSGIVSVACVNLHPSLWYDETWWWQIWWEIT